MLLNRYSFKHRMKISRLSVILIFILFLGCGTSSTNPSSSKVDPQKEQDILNRLSEIEDFIDQGDVEWACGTGLRTIESVVRAAELGAALGKGGISLEVNKRFNKVKNYCFEDS